MINVTEQIQSAPDWRCPTWCPDAARHGDDSLANDGGRGGAVHFSHEWRDGGLAVRLAQSTNADRPDGPVEIWLDMHDLTTEQAKAVARNLLTAVATAENSE